MESWQNAGRAIAMAAMVSCGIAAVPDGVWAKDGAADSGDAVLAALAEPGALRSASFAAMHAIQIDAIRMSGVAAATNLLSSGVMTPGAEDALRTMLAGDMAKDAETIGLPSVLAEDFLAGATVLLGPCGQNGAVFAWWNPFWDMLLFVKTGGGELPEPKSGEMAPGKDGTVSAASLLGIDEDVAMHGKATPDGKPPKIEQFLWVGGKAFRGENGLSGNKTKSFSETLWRREVGTVKRFREIYPETDGMAFSKGILRIDPRISTISAEVTRTELRMAAYLRLKAIEACFKNAERKSKAFRGAEFLQRSSGDDLASAFDSFETRPFCQSFAILSEKARRGFVLYGCYEGDGEIPNAMLVFINKEMPRLYATGLFPQGLIDKLDGPKHMIEFEWYDLNKAERLLESIETRTSTVGEEGGAL
ncbi:MAG: hypothetical protein IKO55_08530 [Kiritimatiellae bacterium]|nr:hypothetical protein [Kiritimatiellia bacterium]